MARKWTIKPWKKTGHLTDFVNLTRVHFGSALMWYVPAPLDSFWRPLHHRFDREFQKPYSPAVTFKLLFLFFHWILTSNRNCWRQSATQRKRHFTPLTWWWFSNHRNENTPNRFRALDRLTNDKDLVKDGAYYCYCAYVLRISRYSDFLSPMLTNTGIFLRGLNISGVSRS